MFLGSPVVTGTGAEENPEGSLHLIQEEIAVMKKLHHQNLVSLREALDDPDEDSLYMVLELCQKGVVMKVGMGEVAEPHEAEVCRCWFRDLILGLEYCEWHLISQPDLSNISLTVHAQGIAHRDIKPDNLLIDSEDVLKISDFGVSEMFEKESDMMSAKSAGSPAFMPPELCVPKHGEVSGKAADIWSMGVTLYCLRFGRVPFEADGLLEMYQAIRENDVDFSSLEKEDPQFVDLMNRILEKDPAKRIRMDDIRVRTHFLLCFNRCSHLQEHPWVTNNGSDPLMSKKDNIDTLVELPTEKEINHAITHNIGKLFYVVSPAD